VGDSSPVTQLELGWVRERRAACERAYPDVLLETREVPVPAAEFAAFERSGPYRGSGYAWVVRDPTGATRGVRRPARPAVAASV